MSWFSFYLLCGGMWYISRVIWSKENSNEYKGTEFKEAIIDAINKTFISMIVNYVAWLFLKNSLPEFIEMVKVVFSLK
ncbi:MAG: hypothetical protein ACRC51_04175 [Cetobacterium sp.]